jgi:hypothetical protein
MEALVAMANVDHGNRVSVGGVEKPMLLTRTLLAALLFLPLAACGDDDGGGDAGPSSTTGGRPGGDGADLFVAVETIGGLLPPGVAFRDLPRAAVYADGTILVPGVITLQFPGPPVLPLAAGTLDDAAMDELLDAARDAGMVGGTPDVGDAGEIVIADAATTRVTVVVDGDAQVVEAYALGEAPVGGADAALTDEQRAARLRLTALLQLVEEAGAAATSLHEPERYRVLALAPGDDGELDGGELAWPDGLPEPVLNECVAITGDDVTTLEQALSDANERTRWTVGDDTFVLAIRPVLPHEPDC